MSKRQPKLTKAQIKRNQDRLRKELQRFTKEQIEQAKQRLLETIQWPENWPADKGWPDAPGSKR